MSTARDNQNLQNLKIMQELRPASGTPQPQAVAAQAAGTARRLQIIELGDPSLTVGGCVYQLAGVWTDLDETIAPPVRPGLVIGQNDSSSAVLVWGPFPRVGTPGALLYAVTAGEGYLTETAPAGYVHIVGWQMDAMTAFWNPVDSQSPSIVETVATVLTEGAPYYLQSGGWTSLDESIASPVRAGLVLSTDGSSSSQMLLFGTFPRSGTSGAILYAVTAGEGYLTETAPTPNAHIVGWQIDSTTALWNPVEAGDGTGFPIISPDTNWTITATATDADGGLLTLTGTDGSSITLQNGPGGKVITMLDSSGNGWQMTPSGWNPMVSGFADGHGPFTMMSNVHACIAGVDTVIDVLARIPT